MQSIDLISTLAGSFAAALMAGFATQRLGLSPIVGYLFAGILVGPHTPGFVADQHLAEQLAEIGVILLMFGVGLQFHVEELLAVRRVAIPGALVQSAVATALGAFLAHWFGWTWSAGLVFGVALSVASTVVLIRVLTDSRHLHTRAGHIAVGWLVVEDLLTVLVLVLMTALFGAGRPTGLALTIGLAALKVGALVLFTMVAGNRLIPWLLARVAATRSRELFTLCVLVLALGIAVGSAAIFGVSMALGAFLAGLVVARSDFSVRAASEALPMRDAFAVLFFVSVGMLLDPLQVLDEPRLLLAALAIVLVGKPVAALAITIAFGYPLRVGLAVAVALAQVGEFSFIVANLGASLGVISPAATNTLIACAIASITLNPLLYRLVDPVATWWSGAGNGQVPADGPIAPPGSGRHQAVVVGYGPVGRTVTRLLSENEIAPTVVELNMDTVKNLKGSGIRAVYGDANHLATLEEAGARQARSVIFTISGMTAAATGESIRLVRELNPKVQILARTAYLRERDALRKAGADQVFSGEGEVALTLTESILASLGATAEQIDRERARVHGEMN